MNQLTGKNFTPFELGKWGEKHAIIELQKQGYRLLEQNYRCRYGEIDCIFYHDDNIVFVEVKTRRSKKYGSAIDAISIYSMHRMSRTATVWLMKSRKKYPDVIYQSRVRFDIYCIDIADHEVEITHHKDISLWD